MTYNLTALMNLVLGSGRFKINIVDYFCLSLLLYTEFTIHNYQLFNECEISLCFL